MDHPRATEAGLALDPTVALPQGLVAADRASAVTFHGDFVIVQSGIGREGTSGWKMEQTEILTKPTDEELGEAVIRSLAASYKLRADAPFRPLVDRDTGLERAVGARSTKAYINASRIVFVHRRDRRLFRKERTSFYPSRTVPGEGHSVLEERELVSVDHSPVGIGRGVREALELCT